MSRFLTQTTGIASGKFLFTIFLGAVMIK